MPSKDYETRETNQARTGESTNSFLLGAIIGGVVGAATALLFAPRAGKEIRSSINNQASSLKEKTVQLGEDVLNKSNEIISKTSSVSQDIVQQSTDFLNKAMNRPKEMDENEEGSEPNYIPIQSTGAKSSESKPSNVGKTTAKEDITKKLEEAKKAFDEEENKVTY